MIQNTDTAVSFRYSRAKLFQKTVVGVLLTIFGLWSIDAFTSYLIELRIDQALYALDQGLPIIAGDPIWAVVIQIITVLLPVVGVIMASVAIFKMFSRDRIFMRVTSEGLYYYRLKFHAIRIPYVDEEHHAWYQIADVSKTKKFLLGERVVLTRSEISINNPKKVVEIPIRSSESTIDEIVSAIKLKWMGR